LNPIIPVFIGSPNDVAEERHLAEAAVNALAPRLADIFGVTMVALRWESFAPISSADASHPQIDILKWIRPYSIFVGILFRRYGTTIAGVGETGTETEFNHALKHRDRIKILSYFRDQDRTSIKRCPLETRRQMDDVKKLQNRLQDKSVRSVPYRTPEEFGSRVLPDLMEAALKMILQPEPIQLKHYAEFFRFGRVARRGSQPIHIAYPSANETGHGERSTTMDWSRHLLPRIVFEDAKAIQDVEGVMRLLAREYRTGTTDSPELNLQEPGDRVWVCVPRNRPAHEVLARLGERVRFEFGFDQLEGEAEKERFVRWKARDGRVLAIRSPLNRYLTQSCRPPRESEWQAIFGHTIARDYAVLARFKVEAGPPAEEGQTFYHYFIGGIRGLGTWGAGWFIDHCADRLGDVARHSKPFSEAGLEDVQVLLEVTFKDYRIVNVEEVSERDQSYFDSRFSEKYVTEEIQRARPLACAIGSVRRASGAG